jgi:hypothetical protein
LIKHKYFTFTFLILFNPYPFGTVLLIALNFLFAGVLLLQLTGHRDLVTNLDFISIPLSLPTTSTSTANADSAVVDTKMTEENGDTADGEITTKSVVKIEGMTDMIVSVSDDQTARVFYLDAFSLLT